VPADAGCDEQVPVWPGLEHLGALGAETLGGADFGAMIIGEPAE